MKKQFKAGLIFSLFLLLVASMYFGLGSLSTIDTEGNEIEQEVSYWDMASCSSTSDCVEFIQEAWDVDSSVTKKMNLFCDQELRICGAFEK